MSVNASAPTSAEQKAADDVAAWEAFWLRLLEQYRELSAAFDGAPTSAGEDN